MSSIALSRLERVYMALQGSGSDTDFQTVPTFGNSNAVRHIKVMVKNDIGLLVRRDKTGSRTATLGTRGRGFGNWSYEGSLAPSGVNGTPPDFDPLMQSIFGQASVSGGGGLQYKFTDLPILAFGLASYRQPSTLNQKIAYGCVVNEATFNIGQDVAEFTASGECRFVVESDYFSAATVDEKGGLSVFPTEPSAPVTHGGIIAGFTGSITIGGSTIARIRTATVKVNNGTAVIKDTFGHFIPDSLEGDVRNITTSFTMYEDDSAAQEAIREATITKVPVNASYIVGTVAGSIVQFDLINVQLASYDNDDSARRWSTTVPDSRAYGTSLTSKDELMITIQ